jgi:cytidylate kinase
MNRTISPLRKDDDAIEIDNTNLDEIQQFNLAIKIINNQVKALETAN